MSSPTVEVRVVDVHDEADLQAWWAVGHAASAERPYDAWPPWELARRALPRPRDDQRHVLLLARSGGREVGCGLVVLPALDNTHLAQVEVHVVPDARRRGVGSALLAQAEAVAADDGRTTLLGDTAAPPTGTGPGPAFAAAHGYVVAETDEAKLLDLAAAPAGWNALEVEVAERLGGHRVVGALDRVPDALVEGVCGVLSVFVGMLPPSERDKGDIAWDAERLRAGEARNAANDRRQVMAVALDPGGRVVGLSDVRVDAPTAPLATVGITLVLPEARGHRLGLAMKLETHRTLLRLREEGRVACTHVETQNAEANGPMNDVNDRLGYRVAERVLEVQKRTLAT
ncbi:GNAT family N-acetyltransferase [Nocardioides sp. CFH 31398]|uniref:GNAT family N-acetyltransferase n=1 Tax=Nocardioides sp. CFH 31398 TaxID=2919579 RepID=UPI001F060C38|nr:GNAT family N-acetyltransferase [Nocardioides sp. CFH 31398]MCH1866244.1 GNAT family N-acetyltransferase [Nocardioides sp. CFH 31398]